VFFDYLYEDKSFMMFSRSIVVAALVFVLGVVSCNIWKKGDPDEGIRVFLSGFEASLKLSDDEILKQFKAKQSKESILSAIHVLQNKESEYIQCAIAFDQTKIIHDAEGIRVDIPVAFAAKDIGENDFHEQSSLTLWLEEKQRGFVITLLEGEAFYKTFSELRSSMQWDVEREEALKTRRPIYARAREIQKGYDSVIWYTTYKDKNYFYVVNGKWVNYFRDHDSKKKNVATDYKMGLVDEAGTVIIPAEYELVGTIGFVHPDVVEVRKDGKTGYYQVATKQLIVAPAYDMIVPYDVAGAYALVSIDSVHGWLDAQYQYHEGFPSAAAEDWFEKFGFLPEELTLQSGNQSLCEIANEENAGYGIVLPPSCYVRTGLFEEIVAGLTTTDMPFAGWKEYVSTNGTLFEKITDGIGALVTNIKERYVEGREEFYTRNRLVFISPANDTLAVSDIMGESVTRLRRIGEDLIEIESKRSDYGYWEEDAYIKEYDIPIYTYFRLSDGAVVEQQSSRTYSFTEFVTLDSSYIAGTFHCWNAESGQSEETAMLSVPTLQFLRKEILAGYGYRFKDSVDVQMFERYPQNVDDIKDIEGQFTEIDRHNLVFLEKVIGLLEPKPM
jgi:hypothetical protein